MSKSIDQIKNLIAKATKSAKSERELSVKGLNFGRWWYEVGEYDQAAGWITKYLRVYDKDDKAHKLLGDIYEKLDKSDAALACYKSSLRVKPQQYELMLKVAEMHINPGPTQNPSRAQVWLDKAAVALPSNPQVYKLKMELLLAQEAPPSKLEDTILGELKKRSNDPSLHVQYVTFLKDQERLDEAFVYSQKTDNDISLPKAVEKDLEWNQCLIDTCQDYAERMCDDEVTPEGLKAYSLLLMSLCRCTWVCMEQQKYDDALENLAMLDTSVFSALTLNQEASGSSGQEWDVVLNESKAQLYWLAGTNIIYQATQNLAPWSEAIKLAVACYSVSLSFPMPDTSTTWATWSKGTGFPMRLKTMAGFRLSQCGHMVYSLVATSHSAHKEEKEVDEREWMLKVTDNYCTEEGRRKVFSQLFGQNYNPETSMIHNDPDFSRASVRLVSEDDLNEYDINSVLDLSLQTWVWTGLQWRQNFDNALDPFSWISNVFPELQLTTSSSVKYGYIWQLCRLDLESFVVACVLLAEKATSLWQGTRPSREGVLNQSCLPLPLGRALVTNLQKNWWDAACKLHCTRKKERIINPNLLKATLRHGMESLRGSGNHGLQLMLIAGLAKHFAAKAYNIDKQGMGTASAPWLAYQRRAAQYWMLALPLLQDVSANRAKQHIEPKDRLFPKNLNDPTIQEARSMISEVYMCNGGLLVQEGDLKGALDTYGKADTPHASFCEALIFKQLLENCGRDDYSFTTGSSSKRREALQRKYQARLEVTLNRLHRQPDDELLRRTEALLHPPEASGNKSFGDEPDGRNLNDTIPKHSFHPGNHTVNFDEDESILAVPGKQSTPKNELGPLDYIPQDKGIVSQISQNLSALTSAVSSLQAQQRQDQERNNSGQKDQNTIGMLCDKLSALTDALSSLHVKEERNTQQHKIVEQQLLALQEQVNRTHLSTPIHPSHIVRVPQGDASAPPTPLRVFDQYQQASLGQVASPGPDSPYYGLLPYQTYQVQNSSVAYTPQGYPVPPGIPAYSLPQRPQQVIDPRVVPSPVNTPAHVRTPQHSNAGLTMSKEGADALSIRFQTLSSGVSQNNMAGMQSPGMVTGPPPQQLGATPTGSIPTFDQRSIPPTYGATVLNPQQQGHMTHAYSEPIIMDQLDRRNLPPEGVFSRLGPHPTAPIPQAQQGFKLDERAGQGEDYGYEASYLSPQNIAQIQPGQEGASMLRSLLISQKANEDVVSTPVTQQVEINYPQHINFPEKKDDKTTGAGSGWSFKFQTPEDMDRENKKLEADEEAEDADAAHNDTGPHFEPIVSLPEVEVRTGEEDEETLFSERAKLYRWHESEWKERGLGNMKILKHNKTGKHRLVMRREQVLKICCNHIIGKDMDLSPMPKSDRAWVWHAIDFSEEESRLEKFAIRFKTPEIAGTFKEKVLEGKAANEKLTGSTPSLQVKVTVQPSAPAQSVAPASTSSSIFGTATQKDAISSASTVATPKFRFAFPKPSSAAIDLAAKIAGSPRQPETKQEEAEDEDADNGPHNESEGPHFEPIVKLPDKVDTKTGEEDEEVLFCHRAKLYRYTNNQWKERGLGDIKILHNKSTNKFRVVMRREQVLKLCANHYITVGMKLSAHGNSDKSWTWPALDHSDPDMEPQQELLAVRFKESDTAADFKKHFDAARDGAVISGLAHTGVVSSAPLPTKATTGIFKLASYATDDKPSSAMGSSASQSLQSAEIDSTTGPQPIAVKKEVGEWTCSGCYSKNQANEATCPCCSTPNPSAPKTSASQSSASKFGTGFSFGAAKSGFSFGVPSSVSTSATPASKPSIFGATVTVSGTAPVSSSLGSQSLGRLVATSKPGAWKCPGCGVSNEAEETTCPCCATANPSAPATAKVPSAAMKPGLFNLGASNKGGFSFGVPAKSTGDFGPKPASQPSEPGDTQSLGRLLAKSKPGAWNCPGCGVSNEADEMSCPCCATANPSAPATAKAPSSGIKPGLFNLGAANKGGFSFGVPCKPAGDSGEKLASPKPDLPAGSKPGLFSMDTVQRGGFSFGVSSKSGPSEIPQAPQVTTAHSGVVSPPKFMFGNAQAGGFSFGAKASFNQNNSGGVAQNGGLFSSKLQSSPGTSVPMVSSGIPKPRFPSVENEEDTTDDDSDASTGSSYESSTEENEYHLKYDQYRSPLIGQQEPEKEGAGDDDVICLGEVLPPVELQERAEKLGLPKHFYNYLKDGENADDDAESSCSEDIIPRPGTGDEKAASGTSTAPTTVAGPFSSTSQTSSAASFGFGAVSSGPSTFAALAQSSSDGGFAFGGGKEGWTGLVDKGPLFANLRQAGGDTSKEGEDYYETDEKDDLHFDPIVNLPEEVSIVTGEEDDDTIYSQRCKLFRWNKPTNEWKERGVGDIKMVRNKLTGRIRIVMRRERILKVCANHYIRPGMTLELNKGSDKAWTWTAMDFADVDEEPKMEKFAAKFKNVEIAFEFKENFEKCQTLLLDADPMTPCKASAMMTKELSDRAEKMKNELQFFKDKFSEPTKIDLNNTLTDEANLNKTTTAPPVGALTPLVTRHKESMRQSLLERNTEQANAETLQGKIDWNNKEAQEKAFADGSFAFQMKPDVPQKDLVEAASASSDKPPRKTTVSVGSGDDPQAEPEVHFEPIIQLPEHVELVTGEEDEQILFGNRGKLYIFDAEGKQWKERGIGDVKIMQNVKSCKVRVLMRREQVLKVCLNHFIQLELKLAFKEKSGEKVLLWTAKDFSENDDSQEEVCKFALRFKDSDRACLFKRIWEEGAEAAASGTLLDQEPSAVNTSTVGTGATSPGQAASPQSPTSPVAPVLSTFSFANVQSPIKPDAQTSNEKQVEIMGFVFGKTPEKPKATAASSQKFKFDMSKMSFGFGSTSTPQSMQKVEADNTVSTAFFTPTAGTPTKLGFSGKPDGEDSSSSMSSTIFSTPNETLTRPEPTLFSGVQSPALQVKSKLAGPQLSQPNTYKPSPLAIGGVAPIGQGFSFQGGAGKFQFKPVATGSAPEEPSKPTETSEAEDDDVIFVSEAIPTEDQRKRAEQLLLPPTFFLYENEGPRKGFDEKAEEEMEDKLLQYIKDRDSGALNPEKLLKMPDASEMTTSESVVKSEKGYSELPMKPQTTSAQNQWIFGGDAQGPASFAAMAANVQSVGFKIDPSFRFPGQGQVMFQDQSAGGDEQDPSNYKCEAQFKPVLDEPPPLIDVKTGEEGEEVLFKERCKLYRYDTETVQWKERGVGEIKILHNTEHKLYRVVMRRDQILKVCTNHVIHEDTDPQPHLGSMKTCTYFAMDYTESPQPTPERFAMRFKTEEICKAYTDKLNEVKFLKE